MEIFIYWTLIWIIVILTTVFVFSVAGSGPAPPKKRPRRSPSPSPQSRKIPISRIKDPKGRTYWCVITSERDSGMWREKEEYCSDLEEAKSIALIFKSSDFYRNTRVVEKEIEDQFTD